MHNTTRAGRYCIEEWLLASQRIARRIDENIAQAKEDLGLNAIPEPAWPVVLAPYGGGDPYSQVADAIRRQELAFDQTLRQQGQIPPPGQQPSGLAAMLGGLGAAIGGGLPAAAAMPPPAPVPRPANGGKVVSWQ